jgi:TolB-like protein
LDENAGTTATGGITPHVAHSPSVFLSYASEDRLVARSIRDALSASGLEVWYDESELDGGDAWDQKIRRQIRECDYFMPLVSAATQARSEGYFRREWRLAAERTLDMADDHTFLLPLVIDDTDEATARVPEKFLAVQWLRVPGGRPTPAFEALCRRIISGKTQPKLARRAPPAARSERTRSTARISFPDFPREEPGQRIRFGFQVVGWALQSARIGFKRLGWGRYVVFVWLIIAAISRSCGSDDAPSRQISPADARKLKAISDQFGASSDPADIARLSAQISREFSGAANTDTAPRPLLAIPFTTAGADPATARIADSTFAQIYGRLSLSFRGEVELSGDRLLSADLGPALEHARANRSKYIVSGGLETPGSVLMLSVKIVAVRDGSVVWSKSYPVTEADPEKIAVEVNSHVRSLDDLD